MSNYNDENLLEIVEMYAEKVGNIASESELSEKFDSEVVQAVIDQYGEDDQVAIDTAFNDWTDSLCKHGVIHPEQYNQYCYVGEYSEE